ncbi:hypothetical protein [Amaricoccus macauensis]|uniref:hypothetical protein n=1 Tax=Amaricoccus macauensis TaxID=57001 RepID=UPI003C79832B
MSNALLIGAMLAGGVLAGPILAVSQSAPMPGEVVVVAVPPWAPSPEDLVARAGGHMVGPERTAVAALAVSEDPAFPDTLRGLGAWLVLDGRSLANICGV